MVGSKKKESLPEHNQRVLAVIYPDIVTILKYTEDIKEAFEELVVDWKPLEEKTHDN